jgi:hypothetical protein
MGLPTTTAGLSRAAPAAELQAVAGTQIWRDGDTWGVLARGIRGGRRWEQTTCTAGLFFVGSRRFGLGERRAGVASPGDVRAVGKRVRGFFQNCPYTDAVYRRVVRALRLITRK